MHNTIVILAHICVDSSQTVLEHHRYIFWDDLESLKLIWTVFTHILDVSELVDGWVHPLHQRQVNVGLLDEAADDVGELHQLVATVDVAVLASHLQNIATLVTGTRAKGEKNYKCSKSLRATNVHVHALVRIYSREIHYETREHTLI